MMKTVLLTINSYTIPNIRILGLGMKNVSYL